MAEATLMKLKERLKCTLCKQIFFKPKILPCEHTFCTSCLDSILAFQNDGSATLRCPNECNGIIKVDAKLSISSILGSNFELLQLVDVLKEAREINESACQIGLMCQGTVHHSCSICGKKTCDTCWKQHPCENKISTSVTFDDRFKCFKAICKEHNSYVTEVCFDCENKFVCVYCANRDHKSHSRDVLHNQAVSTRESLSRQLHKTLQDTPSSNLVYSDEVKKIAPFRELLEIELKERILKKLKENAASLNKEKDKLLLQFDKGVDQFKTDLDDLFLLVNDFDKTFPLYINKVMAKEDFEILSEMNEIIRQSYTFASAHCFDANLKIAENENSLGLLEIKSFTKKIIPEVNDVIQLQYSKSYNDACQKVEDYSYFVQLFSDVEGSIQKTDGELITFRRTINEKKSFSDIYNITDEENIDYLKLLLKHQPDIVHMKDANSTTLLHQAAFKGKDEALSLLLIENHEHINDQESKGDTALILASRNGHPSCVKVLIENNADLNIINNYGNTALIRAALEGYLSCVELLIEHNADLNIKNKFGNTALIRASERGHLSCVTVLIERNAEPNIRDSNGHTALMRASRYGHASCVTVLIEHKADLDIIDNNGDTALMRAVFYKQITCVKILLENNAITNVRNNLGETVYTLSEDDVITRLIEEHMGKNN